MDIPSQIALEIDHQLGLAVYTHSSNPHGYALVVIDPKVNQIIAWDGWYFELDRFEIAAEDRRPLSALQGLDDRDMSVAQYIVEANLVWLPVVGALTWPWYSVDVAAERTMRAHGHAGDRGFHEHAGDLVAYYVTRLTRPATAG